MQKSKVFSIFLIILFLCSITLQCFSFSENYTWSINSLETSSPLKENSITSTDNPLSLECGSAILIEQNSGQVLYSHNIHEKLYPASVTKIMGLLLIMEALDSGKITLETQIPCSENASKMGGSQIWLDPSETLSVNDMLKAISVVSANDCIVALRRISCWN